MVLITMWYWLTEKGKKVAEYLVKIEEVMEERHKTKNL